MLSGLSDEEDIAKGLDLGADDFLTKPIRPIELQARVKTLLRTKQLFDELEAANKMTENLVQMVAHDLRAPLTVVKCISSLLKNKPDPKIKDFGERIHLSSNRAENMINDMLSVMNYSGEALKLNLESIDLAEFFKTITDSLRPLAEQNRMTLLLEVSENASQKIIIDSYLINRLIENLVLNAIKHNNANAEIKLSVHMADETGKWVFNVVDNGVGLPEGKEDIFDMHKTGNGRSAHSHGIGLSYCKLVVEAHKGTIRSYNNSPKGAVFEVELPIDPT